MVLAGVVLVVLAAGLGVLWANWGADRSTRHSRPWSVEEAPPSPVLRSVAPIPGLETDGVAKAIADRWGVQFTSDGDRTRWVEAERPAGGKLTARVAGLVGQPNKVSGIVCIVEQRPQLVIDESVYQDLVACLKPVLLGPDAADVPVWLREQMSIPLGQRALGAFANIAIRVQPYTEYRFYVKVHSLPCDQMCMGG